MKNNYILNKITAIPKGMIALWSVAFLLLFSFVAIAKSYLNAGTTTDIADSFTLALFAGLLLLVIIPTIKHLSHLVSIRKAVLLTMVMAACLGNASKIYAQAVDAAQAVQICNGIWPEPSATATIGTNDLPSATSKGCLVTGEIGSNWYYVKVTTSGKMAFKVDGITSTGAMADIDGAVWGPFTSVAAGATAIRSVAGLAPARCNYSAGKGFTLTNSTTATSVGAGTLLFPTSRNVKSMDVLAGEYYLIYIDNFAAGTANGAVSISIDFTSENIAAYECPAMPTTCGPLCSSATCPVSDLGVKAAAGVQPSGTFTALQKANYTATPFKAGDGTFTQCYTLNSGAHGTLGIVQTILVRGTDANVDNIPDGLSAIASSRMATLTLASNACGTAIPPTTANGGNSGTLNPEWTGLTPNTNYVLCIATTMPAAGATVINYRQSALDVYHWAPPFSGLAPGCTSVAPTVWIKANQGISTATQGAQVTSWTNLGSVGGNVTGGTGSGTSSIANQTTSPTFDEKTFNFNPSVFANATSGMGMLNALPASPTKWVVYYVNKLGDITTWKSHVSFSAATTLSQTVGIGVAQENSLMSDNAAPYIWQGANAGVTNPISYTLDKPYITGWQWASAGTGVTNSINGRAGNTGAALSANNLRTFILTADPDGGPEDGGRSGGTYYAEAMVFPSTISAAEHQRVQSYLAIKYGITLDQTVATNYLSGDGSVVWNVTTNTGFNNNIIGIGKDDCQGLNQKQSKSANGGFQPVISTTGFAATNATNATDLTGSKSFEISGSDAGATSFGASYAFAGMTHRITRIWKIQETGTVGTVKVAIEKTEFSGNATNINLLRSLDATFDNSDTKIVMVSETIGGVEYYTATIDFTNGDYYTFGAYLTVPGCVAADLKTWYKANDFATSATSISQWNDAVNGFHAKQTVVANQPLYQAASAANNFNPTLKFDGTSDHLEYTASRFMSTTSSGSLFGSGTNELNAGYENFADLGIDNPHMGTLVNEQIMWMNGSAPVRIDHPTKLTANKVHQLGYYWNGGANAGSGLRLDGTDFYDATTDATLVGNGAPSDGQFSIGGYGAVENWTGNISELFLYGRNLTTQEKERVETYLAIKYGTTLAHDYLAGDNTKIWDKTANTAYHNNVFGIGRDDCQGLSQKQSNATNGGFQPIISTIGFAGTNATNTVVLDDKSFEMSGSDAAVASFGTAFVISGMNNRMTRVWKIQETGIAGTVKVAVAKSDFGGINHHLIRSTDASIATTDELLPMTVETIGGVEYLTATIDFANGDYYTFGAMLVGPGGVVNTDFWVKSDDAGTIGTAWKDHSKFGNAIEAVGAWSLSAADAAHNFNPYTTGFSTTKYFKDNNTSLTADDSYGVQTRTPFSVFSAVKPSSGSGSGRIIGIDNDALYAAEPGFSLSAGKPYFYKYWETVTSGTHTSVVTGGQNTVISYNATQNAVNDATMRIGKDGTYQNFNHVGHWHNLGDDLVLGYGTWDLNGAFPGDIMEAIWYKRTLTQNEQDRVNSYLAIKNGTTLAIDYLSSNSTIIWNKTANSAFHNNVFGIGRDDASALHQRQSKSTNATGKITLGVDDQIAATNIAHTGGVAVDANFLMVGDNGLAGVTTLVPGGACTPAGPDKGTNRIWKFVETGTVESVKVSTDLSPDFNGASTQVFMQVSTDAAFTGVIANIPARFNSTSGQFETNYDFTGTQYIRYIGVQTPPANACIGGSKDLNWLSFAPFNWWYWGTRSKSYNLGDGLNAQVSIDDSSNKILYGNTPAYNPPLTPNPTTGYYPVNYGNHLYIPRYDGNPTSTITTKIKLVDATNVAMPANGVSFKIKDIDGWWWGKDNVKVYGKLGGSIVNPKLSTNKLYTNVTITQPNQGKGSIYPWDWTVLGDMYVNFDSPVDEIYVEHTKDNLFSFKVFNDIAIGGLDIQCKAPEPEVVTPDNVYLFKEVSPKTARAGEAFTYKFTFKNFNCTDKVVSFTDALPSGMVWKDSTLATTMTIGSTSAYGGSANLNLTSLVVPTGTSYMYAEAVASTTGVQNNQASFTVNGNTYQSDEPSIAGAANATPVTIIAAPQVANLTLTKSVNKTSSPQNGTIEYTLSVKNNGAATVNAQVQDFLEGDATYTADPLVFTPASASTGTVVNTYATTGTLDVRDLAVAAGATITIKVKAKLGTNPVVNDTLSNNFTAKTGLGADAEFYSYKQFTSNKVKTLVQNLPSLAGTVFNDGGAGGGTPGNCTKDGTEGATGLPTGLYAKLIASGATVVAQAVAVNSGTYSFTAVNDGAYTVILDDNTTLSDITSTLPSGWAGTSSLTGNSASGLFTPTLTFCISNVPAQVTIVAGAGTVFNDNGAGGGTANNCTKDGTETAAGIPSGLFAKLIKAGTVLKVEPIDANGGFTMTAVSVGTGYSMIIDNNNSYTDAISNIPANWTANTWTGDVTATTPFTNPALKLCMYYSLPTFTVTAAANTVLHDDGAGGGTAGNCTLDGAESATGLPSPLFAKLIQSGAVVQAAAVASGGFTFSNIPDGSYTIILDNNNTLTDATTTLPSGWTGTTSWAGTLTSGVASPALKFCIYSPPPGPCFGTTSVVGAMPAGAYVTAGNVNAVSNSVDFGASATGILGTDRNPGSVGAYLFKAAAMPLNASNANFIDGYVRKTGGANVTFPVGDNGSYRPAIVNWAAACPSQMEVAYFGADPNIGVTSKLAAGGGGFFPTAPLGGPFPTNQRVTNLFSVSDKEYWDINGTDPAEITLTWNAASNISGLSTSNVNNLSIAGWNATTGKWERIASTIIAGSNLTSGSIKTDATLVPNTYNVYTFAGTIIPNIATVKTAPATISQFVPFNYSFTIKNNGTVATTANTIVRDTLKNGLKYISYSGAWTCAFLGTTASGDDVVECTIYATLAPSTSVLAGLRVNPTLGGAISNTSRTSGGGMTGGPYKSSTNESSAGTPQNPNAGAATTSNVTPIPNLVTTKVAPTTPVSQGTKFDYTITVNNTGSVATSGAITVRDTLKNGLKYVSYTGTDWTCTKTGIDLSGNDVVVCTSNISLVANTGTSGVILTVLPTQATNISNMTWTSGGGMPGGPYKSGPTTSTAGSVQNPTDGDPTGVGNNPGVLPVVPKPILVTTKVGPGTPITQFQDFDYIFNVTNNGAANTTGAITILDTLRNGLIYQSTGSAGWSCTVTGADANGNQILECITSNVINANGDNDILNLTVKATKAAALSNIAYVNGGGIPGGPYPTSPVSTTAGNALNPTPNALVPTPNTASPIPSITTVKAALSSTIEQFMPFDYKFDLENKGSAATSGLLTVRDTLKSGLKYMSMTAGSPDWTCSLVGQDLSGNDVVQCQTSTPIAAYNPLTLTGGTSTYTIRVKPTLSGSITNLAWVNGGGMPNGPYKTGGTPGTAGSPINSGGGSPTSPTVVTPVPILKTAKVAPSVAVQQFIPFAYTFNVFNDGAAATAGVITIKDTLKNGLVFVSGGSASWTCAVTGTDISGNQIVECTSSTAIVPTATSSFPLNVKSTTGGTTSNIAYVNGGGMPGGPYRTAPTTMGSGNPTNPMGGGSTTNNVTAVPNLITVKEAPATAITQFVPFDYTIKVTNSGGSNSGGTVTVRDTLKTGLKYNGFAGTDWTCAKTGIDLYGNDVVVCTYSNAIAVNQTVFYTLNVKPTMATNITNMTWTNGGGMPGGPYKSGSTPSTAGSINNPTGGGPTGTSPTTSVVPVPDLQTAKIVGAGPFNQNQPFTYNFQITNAGGVSTSGLVTILDTLKNGLKYVSGGNTDWTCVKTGVDAAGNDIVRCTSLEVIATGNTTSFPLQVNPTQASNTANLAWTSGGGMPGGPYKSGTTAATAAGPSNPGGGTPTAPTPVGPGLPDVILLISQPSPVLTEGLQSVVQFTVTNQGNGAATGPINVNITLPTELSAPPTFTSGAWTCTTAGVNISCSSQNTATIAINTSVQFDVPVVPAAGSLGKILSISGAIPAVTNENIVNNNGATMTANNPVQTGTRPDLLTVIGTIPTLTEGTTSLIPVTVSNIGNGAAAGVLTFSTNLPNGLSAPATFTQNGWTCNTSGQTVSCSNPNTAGVAPNAAVPFDIPVTPAVGSAGTTPTVTGLVNQVLNELVTNNNTGASTAAQSIQPANRPDVQTVIGQPSTPLVEGSPSNIPVMLNNIGTAPATGALTFSTNLPNGITAPLTFTENGWTCNTSGQTVSCSNPNTAGLPATTGTTNFNIPITPSVGTAGQTPTLTGAASPVVNETATTNNTTSMTPTGAIAPLARPDLTTTIGQPAPDLTEGVTSNIPVTLANIGNAPVTGPLTFSMSLPNGMTTPPTFTNNGWTCSTSGQSVNCTNPNAAGLPATTGTTTFTIPVTPAAGTAGQTPTLTGNSAPAPNETSTANNSGSMTPTNPVVAMARPDILTTIGQPAPGFTEGTTSLVPVTLANIGNGLATGPLSFSTTLPNGLTSPLTFTNNGWTCSTTGQTVNCTNPNTTGLPATTGTTMFEIPVTPLVGSAGQTPSISGNTPPVTNETTTTNNSGSMTPTTPIVAMARPDVQTVIGAIPTLTEGTTSNIPVTLNNIGNAAATGTLSFSTTLPNGLSTAPTFTNNGWTCSTSGQTVNCSTPNAAGLPATTGTTTFNLPVTPAAGSAGQTPTVSGTVAAAINETVTTNNTASSTATSAIVAAARPDMTTTIGTPSPVLTEGVQSNIPITLANIGNAPATGPLTFTSMLPNGLTTPSTFTNNGWTCTTSAQTVSCSNPNTAGLPATTGTTTFNLPVTPSAGTAGQTPTLSGTSPSVPGETTTGNNGGSLTLPAIVAAVKPDLALSFGSPSPALAETVLSSIPVTVANIGTATATGQVVVTISIPNNTTSLASYVTNGWTCNASGTTLTCATPNFAGIASAASTTFDIRLTPNAGTAGQYVLLNGNVSTVAGETNTVNNTNVTIVPTPIAAPPAYALNVKMMLQGAMLGTTDGLMRDNLRTQNLIPLTSPYDVSLHTRFTKVAESTTATTIAAVLSANAGTSDAIVDWVFIELRNSASPSTVVRTISALVQRDGDVVAADGQPLLISGINAGSYFVAIKHRNHLGAMTASTVALSTAQTAIVDFTTMTNAQVFNNAGYDGYERATIGAVKALWAGNCNSDTRAKYDGASTDRQMIATNVLGHTVNTSGSYVFNNAIGYFSGDVNMDGKAKYDGSGNDRILIQQLIQTFGLNATLSNNYNNFLEQLP